MTLSNLTQLRYNLEVGPDMRKGFDQVSSQVLFSSKLCSESVILCAVNVILYAVNLQ